MAVVTVDWSEKVLYRSEVEVDDDAVLQWQKDAGVPEAEWGLNAESIKEFLEAGDTDDWKPTGNLDADWVMNDDVSIDGVDL